MARKYWKRNSDNDILLTTVPENENDIDQSEWIEIAFQEYETIAAQVATDIDNERTAEINQLKLSTNRDDIRDLRRDHYPSIPDQLDKLWHCIDADETLKTQFSSWYNSIKTVKDDFPFNE